MKSRAEDNLRAKPGVATPFEVYANGVNIRRSAQDDNYTIATLSINFGFGGSTYTEQGKADEMKARDAISKGIVWLDGSLMHAGSPDRAFDYYTLDLSLLIPEGWDVRLYPMSGRLREIGIAIAHPDHVLETGGVHILTNDDLHSAGDDICLDEETANWYTTERMFCYRNAGHLGTHQHFGYDSVAEWSSTAANRSPAVLFGFRATCPFCGEVGVGSKTGVINCFTCDFWLEQAAHAKNSFVVGGRHYRPGKGGFGGRKFKIERNDGTTWEGELFTQGEIPSWMKDRFPDNAEFVSEQWFPKG